MKPRTGDNRTMSDMEEYYIAAIEAKDRRIAELEAELQEYKDRDEDDAYRARTHDR